ncbi:ribosome small subunit-dependent GTPase A [Clostridium sulfidigenes]|uniref:ribosome small subunit-dependent GTPase A n=1 Tax=Clostridium sulfidigenes TaxID=318464 RepID=UPI003F8C837A
MQGLIVKGIGGLYYVDVEEEVIECKARGKFRHKGETPMIGDEVIIEEENGKGVITEILKRKNQLIRPAVANVTQAFVVVTSKNPDLNLSLLYKFLVLCEYNHVVPIICFNKMDIESDYSKEIGNMLNEAGYEIMYVQGKHGVGIEQLKEKIKGNITVFCGPSGVGKSTILNKVLGRDAMKTGDISDKLKRGKHTTRHSELIRIEDGFLVDTPGFSSLELDFIDKEELQHLFPEFEEFKDGCKFNNCVHYKEPGCIVKQKVESGQINKSRYEFYIKTLEEIISRGNRK